MHRTLVYLAALSAAACGGTVVDDTRSGSDSGGTAGARASGGASDSGGTAGARASGGAVGAGGAGGASQWRIEFEFDVAGSGSYCQHGCAPPAMTIVDITGHLVEFGSFCQYDCATCTRHICPAIPCLPDAPVTTITRVWDGTDFTNSTCGSGMSCVEAVIAPPGTYVAAVCLTPGYMSAKNPSECVVTGGDVCGSISFEFPSSDILIGTIGM